MLSSETISNCLVTHSLHLFSFTGFFRDNQLSTRFSVPFSYKFFDERNFELFISVSPAPIVQFQLMFVEWEGFLCCFHLSKPLDDVRDGPMLF